MHLPPVQTVSLSEIFVSGDVIIHDSAVVAPGTILQAAPNTRITIGPGACIGMGVILNACQGAIEIETGAVLGAGVLIIGASKIGKNACVGSLTTIYNASIEPMAIITAGSVIGDSSRKIGLSAENETINGNKVVEQVNSSTSNPQEELSPPPKSPSTETNPSQPKKPEALSEPESDPWNTDDNKAPSGTRSFPQSIPESFVSNSNLNQAEPAMASEVEVSPQPQIVESQDPSKPAPVVGQIYINQLLLTLFPERRSFQNFEPKNQSPNGQEN